MPLLNESRPLCPDVRTGVFLFNGLTGVPSDMDQLERHLSDLGCKVFCHSPAGGANRHNLKRRQDGLPEIQGEQGDLGLQEIQEIQEIQDDQATWTKTHWKEWLQEASQAIDWFSRDCDHIIVGGQSIGALLALLLSLEEPLVSGIVLLSPALRYDGKNGSRLRQLLPLLPLLDYSPIYAPILERLSYWSEEPPFGLKDRRLQQMISRSVERAKRSVESSHGSFKAGGGYLKQLQLLRKEVRRHAKRVACPALVIQSLEDTITSMKNATELCDLMKANDKTLIMIGGCDHVLTMDLRKNEVYRHISDFVIKQSWNNQTRVRGLVSAGT